MSKIISFTGHRPPRLEMFGKPYSDEQFKALVKHIKSKLVNVLDINTAYVGGALGFDSAAGCACIDLGIPIISCIPFVGYESRWFNPKDVERFNYLLDFSKDVVFVDEELKLSPKISKNAKNIVRDKYMVDNSEILIAMYDGNPEGGTYKTVTYAESKNKPVINWLTSS